MQRGMKIQPLYKRKIQSKPKQMAGDMASRKIILIITVTTFHLLKKLDERLRHRRYLKRKDPNRTSRKYKQKYLR